MDFHIFQIIRLFSFTGLSFAVSFFGMTPLITYLHTLKLGKHIRENAIGGEIATLFRKLHLKKEGTPTMGGLIIWGVTLFVVLFSRVLSYFGIIEASLLDRGEVYLPLFTLVSVGILGAIDDWINIKGDRKGISWKVKMIWLFIFASLGAWWFYSKLGYSSIHIPRFGDFDIGLWYIPLFIFIIIASSNAVNFTDGLDGLAAGLLIIAFGAFGILAYAKGLFLLAAFCGVVGGSTAAFLWFNLPPAQLFMGDTGALALGATLGIIAMMTDSVLVLPLIGIIFVVETITIILQLFWKKFFKKKLFSIAPIHHHFEHKGWQEATIVMRFWIIGAIFAGLGLIIGLLGMGTQTIL